MADIIVKVIYVLHNYLTKPWDCIVQAVEKNEMDDERDGLVMLTSIQDIHASTAAKNIQGYFEITSLVKEE